MKVITTKDIYELINYVYNDLDEREANGESTESMKLTRYWLDDMLLALEGEDGNETHPSS